METTRRHAAWVLLALSAVLAGCGGGGDSPAVAPSPPPAPPPPPPGPDTTPPVITLTAPAQGSTGLSGVLGLSAQAQDNTAVSSVEFQVDGAPWGAALTTAPYTASLDTSAFAAGQHVIRARANDAAGNRSDWASATVQFGGSRSQGAGVNRNESWVTGLNNATAFAQAPDGRLLVAEQGGTLRVVSGNTLLTAPFLSVSVDSAGERGLLGVALHPAFASNGWVYVHYTSTAGGTHNRVSRFTASSANGNVAQAGSELVLLDLPLLSSATNHNGGALHFGQDGKLYVGVGDNANGARAPDRNSPLGKLLRLNDDGSVPADNPQASSHTGLARYVWARGLRNPFTFAVQPGSGLLYINDVGQSAWEEVNLGQADADYGWPATEGPDTAATANGRRAPLFAYGHGATVPPGSGPGGFFIGFAIAGGAFYPANGPLPAPWRGNYVFADYIAEFIGVLDLANGHAAYALGSVSGNPVDLLAAADGALLVLTRNSIVRFSAL